MLFSFGLVSDKNRLVVNRTAHNSLVNLTHQWHSKVFLELKGQSKGKCERWKLSHECQPPPTKVVSFIDSVDVMFPVEAV
jgi:hypothetical protein